MVGCAMHGRQLQAGQWQQQEAAMAAFRDAIK